MSAVFLAFLASLGAGAYGSLVGIGGGLIIVPVLSVALGFDLKSAIAASLVGVIATSLSASPKYVRSGLADRRLGLLLLVGATLGGISGSFLSDSLDAGVLALLFGLLLLGIALQMLRQVRRPSVPPPLDADDLASGFASSFVEPTSGQLVVYRARRLLPGSLISFLAGNVSGLLGVGGGVISVPTMNIVMHVPIRVATTTSTYMLAATAAASATVHLATGQLDPLLAAPVALGVIIGARAGAGLSMRVSQDALRLAFIVVAVVFALSMFGKSLGL